MSLLQAYADAEPVNSRLSGLAGMVGSGFEIAGGVLALPFYGAGAPAVLHGWDSFTANAGQTVFGGQNQSNLVAGATRLAQNAGYSPQAASNIAEWTDFGVGLTANALSAGPLIYNAAFSPAAKSASWQGQGAYPGVDAWTNTTVKQGTVLYGGAPGSSNFLFTAQGMVESGGNAANLNQGLQIAPHPILGYRPGVTLYRVTADSPAATSNALANPQYGEGGFQQFFFGDTTNLEPVLSIPVSKK